MKREIFNKYVEGIIDLFMISKKEFFSKTKKRSRVDARYLLYYLCYTRRMRVRYIQDYMEENGYLISHSSVLHGINKMTKEIEGDADYIRIIERLNQQEELINV